MSKKNLILGGILILLVALAYIYQGPFKKWQASSAKPANFLAGIDTDKISKIEIISAGKTTAIEKSGDKWKIAGTKDFYAKSEDLNQVLTQIKEAGKAGIEVVSENKDKKAEFEADESSGTSVKLYEGEQEKASFIVGKISNDFMSNYVAKTGDDKTYLVKANLNNYFMREDWRDTLISKADKALIKKIRLQYPGREFTLEFKDDKWFIAKLKNTEAKKEKVDELLNILSDLNAAKIPEQDFKGTGLEKSSIIIQTTGEGIDNTIMIGNESGQDKGMYFAKRGNSDNIYLISKDIRDQLDKKAEDFK